jgi:hypothetical protein
MRAGMRERSLHRMDEITAYYARQSGVLGVVAFGSNSDRTRFDDNSDLDFLVFVESGAKERLISEVDNLAILCEIDALWVVYNDAVQLLYSDGVLCDFGIILPEQLSTFPHGAGRYLWQLDGWKAIDLSAREPQRKPAKELQDDALFHLYLGLLRMQRGEEAAAFDEIQIKAAQNVLTLLQSDRVDAFSPFRRAEQTVSPEVLHSLMPGYGCTREAAEYMLQALSKARGLPLYGAVGKLLNEPSSKL